MPLVPPPAAVRIEIDVVAPSKGASRIVVGAGGKAIAACAAAARQELEAAWEHPVHLHLRVKVAKGPA